MCLFFTGCQKNILCGIDDFNSQDKYYTQKINLESINIKKPYGVCEFEGYIVICDYQNNTLVLINENGDFVKTIGKIGSGKNEFLNPTGLTVHDKKLYIVNSGNNRVKVLDSDFNYIDEYKLNPLVHQQAGYIYIDIAVNDEGTIYVTNNSVGKADCFVTVISPDKTQTRIKKEVIGYLAQYNKKVYLVNTLELFEEGNQQGGESGKNYLYSINNNKLKNFFELPFRYTPCDFVITKKGVACISSATGSINVFAEDGKQMFEIGKTEKGSNLAYIAQQENGDFIVSNSEKYELFFIKKEKG